MAKSRKSHKAGRRSTRRRGGAFASVVDACRKILDTKSERQIKKHYGDATKAFKEMSEEEQNALDMCFNAALGNLPREEAEQAIQDLEGEEEPVAAPVAEAAPVDPAEAARREAERLGILIGMAPRGPAPYAPPAAALANADDAMDLSTPPPIAANQEPSQYTQYDSQGDVIMEGKLPRGPGMGGRKRKSRKGGRKHKKSTRRH